MILVGLSKQESEMEKVLDKFAPVVGAVGVWWFFGHEMNKEAFLVVVLGWWFVPQVWDWLKGWAK